MNTLVRLVSHLPKDPLIEKAYAFAAEAHASIDQRRKYTDDPYIHHPVAVARIVAARGGDVAMICTALLHDVIEDTPVTEREVRRAFGEEVGRMVPQITDISRPEDGNRAVRKAIDREHLGRAEPRVKTVKLADLIHNSGSILRHDPHFAKVYLKEKALVLPLLDEGDYRLQQIAHRLVISGRRRLEEIRLQEALRPKP